MQNIFLSTKGGLIYTHLNFAHNNNANFVESLCKKCVHRIYFFCTDDNIHFISSEYNIFLFEVLSIVQTFLTPSQHIFSRLLGACLHVCCSAELSFGAA